MGDKNSTVKENQINILSAFNNGNTSDEKVSTIPKKVEEISSTKFNDNWITNEENVVKQRKNEVKACWHVRMH